MSFSSPFFFFFFFSLDCPILSFVDRSIDQHLFRSTVLHTSLFNSSSSSSSLHSLLLCCLFLVIGYRFCFLPTLLSLLFTFCSRKETRETIVSALILPSCHSYTVSDPFFNLKASGDEKKYIMAKGVVVRWEKKFIKVFAKKKTGKKSSSLSFCAARSSQRNVSSSLLHLIYIFVRVSFSFFFFLKCTSELLFQLASLLLLLMCVGHLVVHVDARDQGIHSGKSVGSMRR